MTDFDETPPMPVDRYLDYQRVVPGMDDLYRCITAIGATRLTSGARVLVVGAGGGREIEALTQPKLNLHLTGVDPSHEMLELARSNLPHGTDNRAQLVQGVVADLPPSPLYDGATSVLVMHFLPDDGAKAQFLAEIRSRLKPGSLYIHVDASIDSDRELDLLAPAVADRVRRIGLPDDVGLGARSFVERMLHNEPPMIVSEQRTRQLLTDAGFNVVTRFFTGFWYRGWWAEAA